MTDPTHPTPPTQPAEPTPVKPIEQQAIDALAALNAVPVMLIIPLVGQPIEATQNIVLPTGWRFQITYVERPK